MASSSVLALAMATAAAAAPTHHYGMTHRQNIWAEPLQCSSYLSTGPAHFDVEIRLGGLPPSTPTEPVHLQWWSARKSPNPCNPIESPNGCSVWSSMLDAYPRFTDTDFNGGNLPVSETGEVTIHVGAPSAYFVWNWVAKPRIHLRLCMGENGIQRARSAANLVGPRQWISPVGSNITILEATFRPTASSLASSATNPPVAVIVGPNGEGQVTTTTLLRGTPSEREVLLTSALDDLDLSALEFSPVYACLLEGRFFDDFSFDCLTDCPANTAVVHGQCVLPETAIASMSVDFAWEMSVDCNSDCWQETMNSTLHSVRLAIAGRLDIPFQEVTSSLYFPTEGRRLSVLRTARLKATVVTKRVSREDAIAQMASFGQDPTMTEVLGLPVVSAVRTDLPPAPAGAEGGSQGEGNDPYVAAYEALEESLAARQPQSEVGPVSGNLSKLPVEAIIIIAAGVVLIGGLIATFLVLRRRRSRREVPAKAKEMDDGKLGNEGKDKLSKEEEVEKGAL